MKTIPIDIGNTWLTLIIGICTIIIAALAFVEDISNKRHFEFMRLMGYRFLVLLLPSAIIVGATLLKDYNNDIRNSNEQYLNRISMQENFDHSLKVAANTTAEASAKTMAKYYLKYDSKTNEIKKIVADTLNRKNITQKIYSNTTIEEEPELDFVDIHLLKFRNDSLDFSFDFKSKKSGMKNLNLDLNVAILKAGVLTFSPQTNDFIPKNTDLVVESSWTASRSIWTNQKNLSAAFFYITGSYNYKKKRVPIELLYSWDFKSSRMAIPQDREKLLEYFRGKVF